MLKTDLVHGVEITGDGPTTHAIVIGIGTYPFGRQISDVAFLEDLKSPTETARAIADWLILNYDNPLRPLVSVSLIVSDAQPFHYRNPATGVEYVVPSGTTRDIENAVAAWATRAGSAFDNGSVFYYCGHGLSAGYRDCMLSRSFGENANRHLDGVFEISSLSNAMRALGPKHQLFFFDTCRNEAPDLLSGGVSLPALLHPRPGANSAGAVRQCRFYATAEGSQAFGEPEGMSLFSKAFLLASKTAGRKVGSEWWVSTSPLIQHLNRLMPEDQVPQIFSPVFDISRIGETVTVPVVVCCNPGDDMYRVKLDVRSEGGANLVFDGSAEIDASWSLSLETGQYVFGVTACNAGEFAAIEGKSVMVYPPYTDIVVDVARGTVSW